LARNPIHVAAFDPLIALSRIVDAAMRTRIAIVVLLASAACTKKDEAPPKASEASGDPNVKPVYPDSDAPVPPLVQKLCAALHRLPHTRKAECCAESLGIEVTAQCEQTLGAAVRDGAVTLDEAKAQACEAAMIAAYEGCDWMGPNWQRLRAECLGLTTGHKKLLESCRSSLECEGTLRCHGAGPTDVGKCGPAAPVGSLCGTAVDVLGAYARQNDYDLRHPSCADGYCDRNRCQPRLELGAACVSSPQCGPGRRCGESGCVEGEIGQVGESCSGADCAAGLACVFRKCVVPKPAGEPCSRDAECKAACILPDGKTEGVCGKSCDTAPILKRLSKPMVVPPVPE
jgi:hypothetical protein